MRHRILVVAHDVMLRSTLARWLMLAGYSVELAEGKRWVREVFRDNRIALTILADGHSGAPALDLDKSCGRGIVVIEPPRDAGRPERAAPAVDGSLSIPLDEQAVLAAIKSVLEAEPSGSGFARS